MTQDKQHKKAVRARMAATGEPYTEAARHVASTPTEAPTATVDRFGGHDFEYERETDLFRCTECEQYEVVAQRDDGSFTPCPGLSGWDGDPERVYLLVTENPAVYNASWHLSKAARELRIGRGARFGYRDGRYLIESAPSVVDRLHRVLAALTEIPSSATSLPKPGGERVVVATAIEPLTFEQGQALIAENHAAYVAEYGEPDRPYRPAAVVIGAGSPETSALTHCPTCGSPEWLDNGRRGWNPVDVECEVCAGTYDNGPDDPDDTPWPVLDHEEWRRSVGAADDNNLAARRQRLGACTSCGSLSHNTSDCETEE